MAGTRSKTNNLFAVIPIPPLLLLLLLFIAITSTQAMHSMKKTKTQIEFYMHDLVKARNVTAVTVTKGSPGFGMIRVIDDLITQGPQHNSKEVGRGRGMYVQASLQDVDLLLVFTVIFQAGEHNGSTLCLQGRDNTQDKQREIAVVGGTGHFRHATGHAIIETKMASGPNAVLKFNVSVLH